MSTTKSPTSPSCDSNRVEEIPVPSLLPVSQIVSSALSNSSLKKKQQAEKLLLAEARLHNLLDPIEVSEKSPQLVLNVLHKYSGLRRLELGVEEDYRINGRDAVNGVISGLRLVYRDAGHVDNWQARIVKGEGATAHGNPLEGNNAIKEFRKMHSKKLAELGNVVRTAPPLSAEHVIEHGRKFMLTKCAIDKRDIMLHAFFLTAMNCGMRYDELSKVRMENVTTTKYGIEFSIVERCKNSNSHRSYSLRRWPGNHFSKSLLMDPLFAFSSWIY